MCNFSLSLTAFHDGLRPRAMATEVDLVMDSLSLFGLLPTGISFGLCLAACLKIFQRIVGLPGAPQPSWSGLAIGAALGLVVWIQPFVTLNFLANPVASPLGVAASLALSLGSGIWAVVAFARCRGTLRAVAPGAILGLGIATSHAALLMSLTSAADASFDDAPFSLGVAIASGAAAAAFAALRAWRRPAVAAVAITVGLLGSQMLARTSIGFQPIPAANLGSLPAMWFAPLAALIVASLLAWMMATRWEPARLATTGRAARGSSPPAPAPRRAGTASPRPAPGRSVAAPAAGLGRPAPPAR